MRLETVTKNCKQRQNQIIVGIPLEQRKNRGRKSRDETMKQRKKRQNIYVNATSGSPRSKFHFKKRQTEFVSDNPGMIGHLIKC